MKLKYLPLFILLSTSSLSATAKESHHKNKKHREHGAHQHGAGKMGIAFDGVNGKIDLKIPSESIFGFEHAAKSETDKKQMQDGLKKLETRMAEMVVFSPELKCLVTKDKVEVIAEAPENEEKKGAVKNKNSKSEHSETVATFNVLCEKTPSGSRITFNIQKVFPQIKDMDVDVLIGSSQMSIEAKKSGTTLDLLGSQ